jgi:outer membrane protein assembly factor BamB
MCPALYREVPPPVVSHDAAYIVACNSEGFVLLGLSLETGEQLWPQQLLATANIVGYTVEIPPSPVWSSEDGMVYAAAFGGQQGVFKVSAHSASTGEMVWATNVSGHSCYTMRWLDVAAVSRGMLLLWDNFTLRAVQADSGKHLWDTSSMNFSIALGSAVPVISTNSMLVPISYEDPSCDVFEGKLSYFAELAVDDGTLLGFVDAPSLSPRGMYAAEASSPVSAGGLWVFTWTPGYPQQSVVFALKPSTVDSAVVV